MHSKPKAWGETNLAYRYTFDGRQGVVVENPNAIPLKPGHNFFDPAAGKAGQPGPAAKSVADGRDEEIYNEALNREFDIRHHLTINPGEARACADAVAKLKAQGKSTQQAVDEVVAIVRQTPGFEQRPADEAKWWADLTVAAREAAQARMKRAWGGAEE